MKKAFVILIGLISPIVFAQQANYHWSGKVGGTNNDATRAVCADQNGSVYITGSFDGTADIDPSATTNSVTANGGFDIYLSKLNSDGSFAWSANMGGTGSDFGFDVGVDGVGNVYSTGYFQNTVDFDPGSGVENLSVGATYGAYIQKLDPSGNFIWAKQIAGSGAALSKNISVQADGVYITGNFSGTIDADPGSGTEYLVSNGFNDAYVVKLDLDGNLLWAINIGDSGNDYGYSVDSDGSNVYISGAFENSVDFNTGLGSEVLTSNGSRDIFILKLTSDGDFVWAKSMGGTGNEGALKIVVDGAGNVYTTGSYSNTVDFDPGTGVNDKVSNGALDIFLLKLNNSGDFEWAHSFGDSGNDQGQAIDVDNQGDVYITGLFQGIIDFDPGLGISNLSNVQGNDQFIVRFNTNGEMVWVLQTGGPESDNGAGIFVNDDESFFVVGGFAGTLDMNPGSGVNNQTSFGLADGYIQAFEQCSPDEVTDIVSSCGSYTWINGTTYTTSNNTATYTLSNVGGCDSTVNLDLTINTVDTSVTVDPGQFTANASGAGYQWIDCSSGLPVSGATNNVFIPSVNGMYAVIVYENSCSDTSSCYSINNVGIDEGVKLNWNVFPNPTTNKLYISMSSDQDASGIYIRDLSGKTLKAIKPKMKLIEMDVSSFSKGIYFIEVEINRLIYTKKFIVE